MDWEWAKLGRSEAHLKVWRAWVAVFCSNMRWAMWSWVGTGVVEMGFDWKGRLISLWYILVSFEGSEILGMETF